MIAFDSVPREEMEAMCTPMHRVLSPVPMPIPSATKQAQQAPQNAKADSGASTSTKIAQSFAPNLTTSMDRHTLAPSAGAANSTNTPAVAAATPPTIVAPLAARPTTGALTGALYLGSMAAVHDSALLHEHDISHLVQVLEIPWMPQTPVANGGSTDSNGFACHRIDLEDRAGAALQPHLAGACDYIARALGRGESVLVHCQQGVSRSAAIVIAYFIREQGISYDAAFALVHGRRRCIKPNSGFVRTLREWEKECAGLTPPQASKELRAPLPSKSR